MMAFQKIDIKDLDMNVFQTIGQDWMLITAGDQQKINTMTASWGGMGVFWGENVVHAYIRPQRYTKQFVDQQSCFSLSFFDGYKKELSVLGTVSGRDTCKIEDVHLFLVEILVKLKMFIFILLLLMAFLLLKKQSLSLL